MNEGIGAVLRFGAYNDTVYHRRHCIEDLLGPVSSKALHNMNDGLNVNVVIAKSNAMGDEFHQRNIAASLAFVKEVTAIISSLVDVESEKRTEVLQFL